VDLDGDGHPDVLSGSWPGELYLFRGEGKGKFAAGETIKDRDGKPINVGRASTVFAADWNGNGKLDLVVGTIEGNVFLIPNEGTAKKCAFGKPRKLEADGKPIQVPHGDAHPVVADWDRDGKLDLIVGTGAGSVLWYRNVGTNKQPKLAAARTLVAESPMSKGLGAAPKEGQCGMRAKICVTDWNGDGWLDLLVGDFGLTQGEQPKLTDTDKAAVEKARERWSKLLQEYTQASQEVQRLTKAPPEETAEAKKQREKDLRTGQEKLQKFQKEVEEVQVVMMKGQPRFEYHGNVWLFLRQPPEAAKAKP
jgi:hypothetical protein